MQNIFYETIFQSCYPLGELASKMVKSEAL